MLLLIVIFCLFLSLLFTLSLLFVFSLLLLSLRFDLSVAGVLFGISLDDLSVVAGSLLFVLGGLVGVEGLFVGGGNAGLVGEGEGRGAGRGLYVGVMGLVAGLVTGGRDTGPVGRRF